MNEHIHAHYLGFIKEQIKSHTALLVEHQKICSALKTLLVSHSNVYLASMTDNHLMRIVTHANNASTLNESLLNALTALVSASKRFKKPVNG